MQPLAARQDCHGKDANHKGADHDFTRAIRRGNLCASIRYEYRNGSHCNNRQDVSRGPQSNTTVYKLNANQTRQVQQSLNQDGFRAGRVDGAIGSHTKRALREFQRQQGLQLTGRPDAETLLMLGIVGAEMQNLGRGKRPLAAGRSAASQAFVR